MTSAYQVRKTVNVQTGDPLLGRIEHEFGPGDHTPRSETEEAALEVLVRRGLAHRVETKSVPKIKRKLDRQDKGVTGLEPVTSWL